MVNSVIINQKWNKDISLQEITLFNGWRMIWFCNIASDLSKGPISIFEVLPHFCPLLVSLV